MNFLNKILQTDEVPKGVKILTYATSIRWIGWGFVEPILPVFLFSFTSSYAVTSLLSASYDLSFILFLPIAGVMADRFKASTLIILGLLIYLFIGSSYFLAGFTGFVIFAILARFLNGISYSLDVLGRDTYARKFSEQNKLATVFGYVDTVANFWWIVAALVGIFLLKYFSIHSLLFLITPTSFIALFIIWYFRRQNNEGRDTKKLVNKFNPYIEAFKEFSCWGLNLKFLSIFNFFIAFSGTAVAFFLPIESFVQDGNLSKAMLVGIFLAVPKLFGLRLGKLFDRKGIKVFPYCFLFFGLLLTLLALSDAYLLKLAVAFLTGAILELLQVGSNEIVTVCAKPDHFGRVGGVMKIIYDAGSLLGPLMIGILIDWQGIHLPFALMAGLMLFLAVLFYIIKDKLSVLFFQDQNKYHHHLHQR